MNVFELDLGYVGTIGKWLVDCGAVLLYVPAELTFDICAMRRVR